MSGWEEWKRWLLPARSHAQRHRMRQFPQPGPSLGDTFSRDPAHAKIRRISGAPTLESRNSTAPDLFPTITTPITKNLKSQSALKCLNRLSLLFISTLSKNQYAMHHEVNAGSEGNH